MFKHWLPCKKWYQNKIYFPNNAIGTKPQQVTGFNELWPVYTLVELFKIKEAKNIEKDIKLASSINSNILVIRWDKISHVEVHKS